MIASPAPTAIAAIQAAARKRIVAHFRTAGALVPDRGATYEPGRRIERRMFERFVAKGVLKPATDGYYLDEAALAADSAKRRKRVGIAVVASALAAAVAFALA